MKVLVVANQKGGVGKTAISVHLAFYLKEQGYSVAFVDFDSQQDGSYTLKNESNKYSAASLFNDDFSFCLPEENKENLISLFEFSQVEITGLNQIKDLDSSVNVLSKSFEKISKAGIDFCIVDTSPTITQSMALAVLTGDYVLSPVEPEAYSLRGLNNLINLILNARKQNTKLKFLGMVFSKVDARNSNQINNIEKLEKAYKSSIIPFRVGLRKSISEACSTFKPVWKIRKTAARVAAKEIKNLAECVLTAMKKEK